MKRYEQCGRSKTSGSVPGTWEHWRSRLPDADRVKDALTMVRGIGDERTRDNVLAKFAPHLARLGRTNDALVMARRIGDESARARALGELGQVDDALALARGISDESARAFALAELALPAGGCGPVRASVESGDMGSPMSLPGPSLSRSRRTRLADVGRLEEALLLARGIEREWARARALATIGEVDEARKDRTRVRRPVGPGRRLGVGGAPPDGVESSGGRRWR